jgi:hypothetical protein
MRRWLTTEVRYLQHNYGIKPVDEIAKHLDRSPDAIRKYASKNLNITSRLPHRLAKDVEEIKVMIYDGLHPSEIAQAIGASTKALYNRVRNGSQYDAFDYRVLLANRRRKGRIPRVLRAET